MVDLSAPVLQTLLFALFAALTAILSAILGPTYDGLLVPELSPAALYPTLATGGGGVFRTAVAFSEFLVVHLVDPAVPLIAVGIGILYLARAAVPSIAQRAYALLPKLVFAVVLANFTLPVAGAILGLAGAGYPVLAGFDGGAWQHWVDLAGPGELVFSWDNGLLTFLLTLVLFGLVLLLATMLALRTALLAVLVVLLPILTLLYPIPALAPLAKRGWVLFAQLAFLPWVVIVPLELAVGSPSILLLVGYLTVAVSAPGLLAFGGAQLGAVGFASGGAMVAAEERRGLAVASPALGTYLSPVTRPGGTGADTVAAARAATRTATRAPAPLALPFFAGEMAGHGLLQLFRHLPGTRALAGADRAPAPFPPVRPEPRRIW